MGTALDVAKFTWDIIKDGAKLDVSGKVVNVLPQGATRNDFSGWQGPISFDEFYHELSSWLEVDLANFTLTIQWEYNGQYIANFNVITNGWVDVLSNVDIRVETLEGRYNSADVAELPYHLEVQFHNLTGGTKLTTLRGVAVGDGSGRSGD
jgi:hypothetical protein